MLYFPYYLQKAGLDTALKSLPMQDDLSQISSSASGKKYKVMAT